MKEKLVGHVTINSGRIWFVDPRIVVCDSSNIGDASLIINTQGVLGTFPVFHIKDDEKGGLGKSRVTIEFTPINPRKKR
jgi:hypothetical protein